MPLRTIPKPYPGWRPTLDAYALRRARIRAKELCRLWEFNSYEEDDLRQELILAILDGMDSFIPEIATWETFVSRLVHYKALNLIEHRQAQRRNPECHAFSLDDFESSGYRKVEEVPDDYMAVCLGRSTKVRGDLAFLQEDLREVMESLPARDAALCERLKTQTLREVAKSTGVSFLHLYQRLSHIRDVFRDRGLEGYLHTEFPTAGIFVEQEVADA